MKVAQIWRYPVKSMAGERLEHARIGPLGIEGDRIWSSVGLRVWLSARGPGSACTSERSSSESKISAGAAS